jgi:hypothetical protein
LSIANNVIMFSKSWASSGRNSSRYVHTAHFGQLSGKGCPCSCNIEFKYYHC